MKPYPNGYLVKLVRDHVSDVMRGDGMLTYRPMPRDEHLKRLSSKLLEEAVEYVTDQTLDELAQVYEVVRSLAWVAHGCDIADVAELADAQLAERGGFNEGIGMYALHPWDTT